MIRHGYLLNNNYILLDMAKVHWNLDIAKLFFGCRNICSVQNLAGGRIAQRELERWSKF